MRSNGTAVLNPELTNVNRNRENGYMPDSPATRQDIADLRGSVERGQTELRQQVTRVEERQDTRMELHEADNNRRFKVLEDGHSQISLVGKMILVLLTAIVFPLAVTLIIFLFQHWR